jgi:hypothetical protein
MTTCFSTRLSPAALVKHSTGAVNLSPMCLSTPNARHNVGLPPTRRHAERRIWRSCRVSWSCGTTARALTTSAGIPERAHIDLTHATEEPVGASVGG